MVVVPQGFEQNLIQTIVNECIENIKNSPDEFNVVCDPVTFVVTFLPVNDQIPVNNIRIGSIGGFTLKDMGINKMKDPDTDTELWELDDGEDLFDRAALKVTFPNLRIKRKFNDSSVTMLKSEMKQFIRKQLKDENAYSVMIKKLEDHVIV